jgi:hypothetical protein
MSSGIPIIDFDQISGSPEAVAQELLQACADWGPPRALCISSILTTDLARFLLCQEPSNRAVSHRQYL